jgi:hypothetical protein
MPLFVCLTGFLEAGNALCWSNTIRQSDCNVFQGTWSVSWRSSCS